MKDPAEQAWEQCRDKHLKIAEPLLIGMSLHEAFIAGFEAGAAYWGEACPEIKENP